jgi:hypothetical protein
MVHPPMVYIQPGNLRRLYQTRDFVVRVGAGAWLLGSYYPNDSRDVPC